MPERWIAEAEQLTPSGAPGTMSGVGPPRAICHVTVSRPGSFDAMHRVLTDKMAEPHVLYDWATDRLGQYFALDRSARALRRGTRDVSCNKVGTVCIQIEFCSMPDGFTRYWTPGPNFRALMRAIASWGITPQFVARANTSAGDNVRQTWETYLATGGWWGHCHVPENDHWDPGPIDQAAFFARAVEITQGDDMTPAELTAALKASAPAFAAAIRDALLSAPIAAGESDAPASLEWAIYRTQSILMRMDTRIAEALEHRQ